MAQLIYPQFGLRPWNEETYLMVKDLCESASNAEDPANIRKFYQIMRRWSDIYHGAKNGDQPLNSAPEADEERACRIAREVKTIRHLDTLASASPRTPDLPHPLDLERAYLALERPWPQDGGRSEEEVWWILEVMGWYQEWPLLSGRPKQCIGPSGQGGLIQVEQEPHVVMADSEWVGNDRDSVRVRKRDRFRASAKSVLNRISGLGHEKYEGV